ncbi:MAG: MazG nucleotide pyrophosphohydrolase domain-containing protein [Phycisphaerae bacterium]
MHIQEAQALIEKMYSHKDRVRGTPATFLWFMEEVGELAEALAKGTPQERAGEFADVFAWLLTLANIEGVDVEQAFRKYSDSCPGCGKFVCTCTEKA